MTKRIHEKYISDQKPPTGNQNCQLCTWCAEASFRGIDILSRPIYSPRDPVFEYHGEDIVIHPIKKQFRNFREMNSWIMGQPNSRFYVHVKWNGGSGGHEFLLLTTNVPHVLDAQQGILSPITDLKTFNSYFGDIDFSETYLCRLDDREFNKALLNKLNSMDELVPWDESKDIPYMKEHGMLGDDEPIQEGAFQDIKNGVNPFSDKLVFHVTTKSHFDGQVFNPRVPEYLDPYDPNDKYFEDNTTPRISFSSSIEGCLNGIMVHMERDTPERFDKMYVYVPEKPLSEYKHKTTKQLVNEKLVWDANVTREVWITEPVRMKLYGTIRVDQIKRMTRKQTTPNAKNEKNDRSYFTFKWHWIVPPKVLEKSTQFEYSIDKVVQWLSNDIKRFKYGLIRDGRLQTGNVSDAEYDKYWVFHSGQEVDEAGGGNCYDYVEYEAGYLTAYGIPYQKYFMSFTTKKNQPIVTHTICVVPYEGKFIYIEGAYKRITSEWGHMRRKTFDKLHDIFDYIAECVADDESKDINFGVWDYTKTKIDYGTPIKEFMNLIFKHCDMIYDGEASKPKTVKEGGRMLYRKPSRFILEADDDTDDITVGDIELDETEDDRNDETETEIETSETEVDDREPDSKGSNDDMDSETESVDEHLDVKNVDLGSFGSDTSDVQNEYDPKEIDILMKLMSSEADAMAEYMDAAKDTNVDVLRRLYADIANEERFHMEQLLFAKSEMTGEKYIPKDPDVKSEYEELLAMGMDEETAMQTAVDKCHIRGTIQSDEDDMDIELSEETETLESAMLQFGMTFDYMLEMAENPRFSTSDYNHSLEIFTEACIGTDLVMEADNGPIRGKKNPISILRNAIGFLVGMITKIVKKFADILRRLGNRTKQIRTYLKRYGVKGLFADNTLSMYFYDMNDPNRVSDSINYFLTLVYDVYDYAGRSIGLNMAPPPPGLVRSPRLQIRSLDDGIEKLNQVDLVKTKTVFPEDINEQTQIVQTLLGYSTEKLSGGPTVEGKSKNVMNYLIAVSEDWKRVMTQIQQSLGQMDALQMQTNSVYHTNKPLFNKAEKGMNACVKACKAFVNALTHDVGVLADLNKRLTDALANLKDKTDQLDARDAGATQPTEQQTEQPAEQSQQTAEQPAQQKQSPPEKPAQQQPNQQQAQQTPPKQPAPQKQQPTTESAQLSKQLPPTAEVPQSQIDSLISSGQLKYYRPSRGFGGDSELTESNKPEWYAGFVNANGQLQVYLNQNLNKKLNTEYPWWGVDPEGTVFGTVAGKPYGLFANLNNEGGPITSQRPALCAKTAKGWGLVHDPNGGVIGGGSVKQS